MAFVVNISLADKSAVKAYTWRDASFKKIDPNVIGGVTDLAAIKNSLDNLFNFRPNQRILLPTYGNVLYQAVGIGITDGALLQLERSIRAMLSWERRITVGKIDFEPDPDNEQIGIIIKYIIPTVGNSEYTYDFSVAVTSRG